jgi:hypothetical protein
VVTWPEKKVSKSGNHLLRKNKKAGFDINMPSPAGETPLMSTFHFRSTAGYEYDEVVRMYEDQKKKIKYLLSQRGIQVNAQDRQGRTALIYSALELLPSYYTNLAYELRLETIKLLLRKGANKTIRDSSGKTACDHYRRSWTPNPEDPLDQLFCK